MSSVINQGAPSVVKSLQRGSMLVTGNGGSNSATITSVDTTKAVVSLNGAWVNGGAELATGSAQLSDATTVICRSSQVNAAHQATIEFTVLEFN